MSIDFSPGVEAALRSIVDPCSIVTGAPIDLIDMGLIRAIETGNGRMAVTLCLTSPTCWQAANIIVEIERKLAALPDVAEVVCTVDPEAQWQPEWMAERSRDALRRLRPVPARGSRPGAV